VPTAISETFITDSHQAQFGIKTEEGRALRLEILLRPCRLSRWS
jgi:hypothetical protein